MEEFEKEICKSIKKHSKHWEDKTDEEIIKYCGFVFPMMELVGNKGFTYDEAIKHLIN